MRKLEGFEEAYKRYRDLQTKEREELKMDIWAKVKDRLLKADRNSLNGLAIQTQAFLSNISTLFEMYELTGLTPDEAHKIYSDMLIEVAAVLALMLHEYDILLDGSKDIN